MTSQLASGDLIADRYALALYDLAAEKKLDDPVKPLLRFLNCLYKASSIYSNQFACYANSSDVGK